MKDIVTEKEALEMLCPYVFGAARPAKPVAGGVDPIATTNCIASKCMAWRLAHKPAASGEETGFCGAFGIPRHT